MMSQLTDDLHGSSKYISTCQKLVFRRKRESIMFCVRFEKKGVIFSIKKSVKRGHF